MKTPSTAFKRTTCGVDADLFLLNVRTGTETNNTVMSDLRDVRMILESVQGLIS